MSPLGQNVYVDPIHEVTTQMYNLLYLCFSSIFPVYVVICIAFNTCNFLAERNGTGQVPCEHVKLDQSDTLLIEIVS